MMGYLDFDSIAVDFEGVSINLAKLIIYNYI